MATKKKIEKTQKVCMGQDSPILKCVGLKAITNFYKCHSEFSDGYTNYCRECSQKIYEHYFKLYNGNPQTSIYYTCQKLDIPFIARVFESAVTTLNNSTNKATVPNFEKKFLGSYMSALGRMTAVVPRNADFSFSDSDMSNIDTKIAKREQEKKDLERFELDWGKQDKEEDYAFLEYRWDVYTNGIDLKPAQESLYRQLCLIELKKRQQESKNESTKDEQSMMITLMNKLGIDKFTEQKDKTDVEKIIERQIWEIENTEPAELVDKKEYEDFLDINKNWGKHILRSLRNLIAGTKDFPNVEKDEWG